jgi:hypothetical protein
VTKGLAGYVLGLTLLVAGLVALFLEGSAIV